MKELVLFYSYSGNTKGAAEKFARENNCDICEITDVKKPGKIAAYTAGIIKVFRNSARPIKPLMLATGNAVNFGDYEIINIFTPVWADHPTPSVVGALKLLPNGAKIKLFMISASGKSGKESVTKRFNDLGLEILGYEDILIK